ncbi:hypothetical protein EPN28_00640 [Patescibacteria group bacterium]|nr:MAG: hypothetical protein EPN28_00640 [Patescibacteria group bacterium]
MSLTKKIILIFVLITGLLSAAAVLAQDKYGLKTAADNAELSKLPISQKTVPVLIGDIIGVGLGLIGIIFFGLILYAGVLWMTALGKPEKAEKGKEIMETAIIGLVIVLAAYAITRFVFTNLVGGGGGSGAGGQVASCQGQNDNTKCGDNSVCRSGNCITKCEYSSTGSCGPAASCLPPKVKESGLCPGGVDNVCCHE